MRLLLVLVPYVKVLSVRVQGSNWCVLLHVMHKRRHEEAPCVLIEYDIKSRDCDVARESILLIPMFLRATMLHSLRFLSVDISDLWHGL